jgi:hypothetical protein
MPEIKDWKRKREMEATMRERAREEGKEVDEVEEVAWEDADVDVSRASRLGHAPISSFFQPMLTDKCASSVDHLCLRH